MRLRGCLKIASGEVRRYFLHEVNFGNRSKLYKFVKVENLLHGEKIPLDRRNDFLNTLSRRSVFSHAAKKTENSHC